MREKSAKILFNISTVVAFIVGTLYIFSLVFIPVGVYCFIAARRFQHKAEHLYDTYAISNNILRNWVIFVSITCFPLGLISIIPYFLVANNNISVSTLQQTNEEHTETVLKEEQEEYIKVETPVEEVEAHIEETLEEKQEKFEKLKNFHSKGIITDDELEMAREQLFGKNEEKE